MEKVAKIEPGAVKVETPVTATPAATTPKIVMPAPKPNTGDSPSGSWMPWLVGGGSALLAHSIMSSILEKPDEEKRKQSVWSRLLSTLLPLGVGAIGAYGGYHLGKSLEKKSQATSTNAWDRVVGKNGRFATVTPPQHSEALDKLLQYVDDNDGTTWEDIVRIANELHGADNKSLERMTGKGLHWGALGTGAIGGYKTIQGITQLHGSRPGVIQARYQKELAKIPPARPGAAPARKWYKPTTWDMFSKGVVKGDARRAMIANMQQAAAQKMQTATRNAPATAAQGWKNLGKGLVWTGVATGLERASGRLADEVAKRDQAASTAEGFLKIRNELEEMMRNSKVVPENVSTNAPAATAQGTAK